MSSFLHRFKIYHETIDAEGLVRPSEPLFWAYLRRPLPSSPLPLPDVFTVLAGLEPEIASLLSSGAGEIRIPAVCQDDRYFNLHVFPEVPDGDASVRGVVAIEDATESMAVQQTLVQDRNEIALLSEELKEKNERLDELMKVIRNQNHDLDVKVKVRTKELHDSRLSIIATLARVAEFRDTDTGGHIYRIGRSCVLIGKRHGLSPEACDNLFHASLLHDIGKIGIPDAVLLKPAALNEDEWSVMRSHTRIGGELLSRNDHPLFAAARDVALYHHERWDGSGYPEGLAGERIPLIGRICAVADVFDALMSVRPYKKAWTEEQAIEAIRKGRGSSFDPAVVDSFMAVLDDILSLRQESEELELLMPEFG